MCVLWVQRCSWKWSFFSHFNDFTVILFVTQNVNVQLWVKRRKSERGDFVRQSKRRFCAHTTRHASNWLNCLNLFSQNRERNLLGKRQNFMRVSLNALEQISIISSKRFDSNWKMFMTLFNFCFRFVRASSRKTSEWWRLLENILKANGEQKSSIMLYLNRSKTKFDITYEWEQVLYFEYFAFKIIICFPISDVLWVGFIITAFSKGIRYLV